MYEAPERPKREIPYPWIVAGLSALSLSLLIITVTDAFEASKNEDALAALRAESAAKESALKSKIDAMSAERASAVRANGPRLAVAEKRIAELTAEIDKLRGETMPESGRTYAVNSAMSSDAVVSRKAQLLAEAVAAYDRGNLQAAMEKFEAIIAIDRFDVGAREGLAMVLGRLPGGTWTSLNHAYLAKMDADSSVKHTASGLRYKVIDPGYVDRPSVNSKVMIRYDAKLVDGSVFDSTKFHDNEPFASGLASLVPALAEGLQLIGIRGKIMIVSPPERAFGSQAQVGVPGDSVIIFEVQLIEVDGHR